MSGSTSVTTRGQTTLDFAIGVAIFLGVLFFVFTFVPGILQPFELPDDEEPTLSDRIADSLAKDQLGSAEHPNVLDRYCTVALFDDSYDASDECNYDGETPEELFDLSSTQNVNITFEGNITGENSGTEPLCWVEDSPVGDDEPGLVESGHDDCTSGDVVLAIGDDVPEGHGATITARRIVSLEGESVTMRVVLW